MSNSPAIAVLVRDLAGFPGVMGCSLVEADTGMAWHHAGLLPDIERVGEAAIEFWRIQTRLAAHFESFGSLQSAAYSFPDRVVALFPCSVEPALVLVCVAAKSGISWGEWGQQVSRLKRVIASSLLVQAR